MSVRARPRFPRPAARGALALCVAAAWAGGAARADEVELSNGERPLRGTVASADRGGLSVESPGREPDEVAAADVASVSWDGEPPTLALRRASEARGKLAEALEGYRAALSDFDAAGPLARSDLEFLIARVQAKLALNDPARRDEAIKALRAWLAANPDHFRTDPAFLLLADVQRAAGDLDAAAATLDEAKQSPSPAFQTAAAVDAAGLTLDRGEADAALAAFEGILADAEGRAAQRAKLGKAGALIRLNRPAEALTAIGEVIAEANAEDAEVMAPAYVRRGDAHQAAGETKAAILAYLHVDVLYPGAAAARAESLFHLAKLWNAAGFPGRAAEAAAALKTDYPGSDWAARLSAG